MSVEAATKPQEARQMLKMAKNRRKLLVFGPLPHPVGMDTAHVDHKCGSEHHRGHAELAPDGQFAPERMLDGADGSLYSGTKVLSRLLHNQETLAFQSDNDLTLVEVENSLA